MKAGLRAPSVVSDKPDAAAADVCDELERAGVLEGGLEAARQSAIEG